MPLTPVPATLYISSGDGYQKIKKDLPDFEAVNCRYTEDDLTSPGLDSTAKLYDYEEGTLDYLTFPLGGKSCIFVALYDRLVTSIMANDSPGNIIDPPYIKSNHFYGECAFLIEFDRLKEIPVPPVFTSRSIGTIETGIRRVTGFNKPNPSTFVTVESEFNAPIWIPPSDVLFLNPDPNIPSDIPTVRPRYDIVQFGDGRPWAELQGPKQQYFADGDTIFVPRQREYTIPLQTPSVYFWFDDNNNSVFDANSPSYLNVDWLNTSGTYNPPVPADDAFAGSLFPRWGPWLNSSGVYDPDMYSYLRTLANGVATNIKPIAITGTYQMQSDGE